MLTLTTLWLPIALATLAVFFASFVMWMVLPHHNTDWSRLPDEEAARAALRDVPAGQYAFPHCANQAAMKDPEWQRKYAEGPSGMLLVRPRGPVSMGPALVQSLVFNAVVSVLVAYVATVGLGRGASGADVLRLTATVAFLGYAGALCWGAIWMGHSWSSTFKSIFDGLVYGLLTGAVFMLLWPAAGA